MQILFGPLADSTANAVAEGKLWIMVCDENDDGQFPGGLATNGTVTDPAAAHAAFNGRSLAVGSMLDRDWIFAVGAIDSTDNPPGVTRNLLDGLDLDAANLVPGRKWALYRFPTHSTTLAKDRPSDVNPAWQWSRNLVDWLASGASDGSASVIINDSVVLDATAPGFITVQVSTTATGETPALLFVRLSAAQSIP
jgi:hypothetical protein